MKRTAKRYTNHSEPSPIALHPKRFGIPMLSLRLHFTEPANGMMLWTNIMFTSIPDRDSHWPLKDDAAN
ncbi:MAG: hypothetical protein CMJ19_18175 [Phycisphaeraceae bacterium]|nr:hypothetical protein [Phycisphaeraceae bacterium]